jgi:hypothetical protein
VVKQLLDLLPGKPQTQIFDPLLKLININEIVFVSVELSKRFGHLTEFVLNFVDQNCLVSREVGVGEFCWVVEVEASGANELAEVVA